MQTYGQISRPAVSQHLKTRREAGLVTMQAEGTRRIYAIKPPALTQAQAWLSDISDLVQPFAQTLDAVATEVARGQRKRQDASTTAARPDVA